MTTDNTTPTPNDRKALLDNLRNHLNARATAQGWRKADGTLSKTGERAALEFIMGSAAAVDALGLDKTHGLTGVAFLAAVRGPGDFMKG